MTKHITRYVDFEQLALARTKEYDVITMLDFLQFLRAMDVMFPKVVSCLKTNGLLVLTLFSAEDIIILSHTPVIETRNSKEISLIPSGTGLDVFMAKFGLRRIWFSKIPKQTSSIFVYQKEEDMIEK